MCDGHGVHAQAGSHGVLGTGWVIAAAIVAPRRVTAVLEPQAGPCAQPSTTAPERGSYTSAVLDIIRVGGSRRHPACGTAPADHGYDNGRRGGCTARSSEMTNAIAVAQGCILVKFSCLPVTYRMQAYAVLPGDSAAALGRPVHEDVPCVWLQVQLWRERIHVGVHLNDVALILQEAHRPHHAGVADCRSATVLVHQLDQVLERAACSEQTM